MSYESITNSQLYSTDTSTRGEKIQAIWWLTSGQNLFNFLCGVNNLKLTNASGSEVFHVKTSSKLLRRILLVLKYHTLNLYNVLTDLVCYESNQLSYRFNMVYVLLSTIYNQRINVVVPLKEMQWHHTVVDIFNGSNWMEREVYDLFGVKLMAHPDQRRILTDYGFTGHPLRKDFPLSGFTEYLYVDSEKRICSFSVSLVQNIRFVNF